MFTILKRHDLDAVVAQVLAEGDPRVEAALLELRGARVEPEGCDVAPVRDPRA